jgi:hypothetical protein
MMRSCLESATSERDYIYVPATINHKIYLRNARIYISGYSLLAFAISLYMAI